MPPTIAPFSSPWWIERLSRELDARAAPMRRLDDYYRGRHPLLYAGSKFRAAFGNLFSGFADNFCSLVADAVDERLDVEGFRMGADKDLDADKDAWKIWQTNGLDDWGQRAHLEALVKGLSYALVWADEDNDESPEVTIEDALQVTVALDPASHDRLAGFKRWTSEDGNVLGTLYLPDRIEKYQMDTDSGSPITPLFVAGRYGWIKRTVPGEEWPIKNPLGEVPIVPFINRPNLRGEGESEIAQMIPDQNAINKLVLDLLVASEFTGFRQRWVTGLDVPNDPDTGQPIEPFQAAVDRLFVAESPDVKFGEFSVGDLANYTGAIEMLVQHIASTTRTPAHYLNGQSGSFPSGESLKATETGLVAKSKRKQRIFGESWEEVIRLSFKILGDARGDIQDSETIWRDPESRTEAEHTDAVVKMGSAPISIPQEMLWEELGFTPQQISRAKALIEAMPETMIQAPDAVWVPAGSAPAAPATTPAAADTNRMMMASGAGHNGLPTKTMPG